MRSMTKTGVSLRERVSKQFLEGKVEIFAYSNGVLFRHQTLKNILLAQGLAEVIRTLCVTTPSTAPRVITRMAIGDQGTIPADQTVPKIPVENLPGLYHEFYRKDVDLATPTLFSPTGFTYTGNTSATVNPNIITNLSSTVGITQGMLVQATGIPVGTVVTNPTLSSTSVQVSNNATSTNVGENITFIGTTNQCEFVSSFAAVDVPLSSFSNPSNPILNEVGLVIVNPAANGLVRSPVFAPNAPLSDEVVLSLRTFTSIPFTAGNNISVTIRYTIFTE